MNALKSGELESRYCRIVRLAPTQSRVQAMGNVRFFAAFLNGLPPAGAVPSFSRPHRWDRNFCPPPPLLSDASLKQKALVRDSPHPIRLEGFVHE